MTVLGQKHDKSLDTYTSHYDPRVNVCFVRVNSFGSAGPASVTDVIYDAFGGRVYATYIWVNPLKRKFWEVPPSECDVEIPGKPEEQCTSTDAFNQLTEKYFGVAP